MRKRCSLTEVVPMPTARGPWFMNDTRDEPSSSKQLRGGSGPRYVMVVTENCTVKYMLVDLEVGYRDE
jgi:hypothetical protein